MNHPRPSPVLGFTLILSGALSGCATFGKCESDICRDDTTITSNVQTSLDSHPELGPPHSILAQTRNKVVYLSGLATTGLESADAEAIARQTPGVARVVSDIAVDN